MKYFNPQAERWIRKFQAYYNLQDMEKDSSVDTQSFEAYLPAS